MESIHHTAESELISTDVMRNTDKAAAPTRRLPQMGAWGFSLIAHGLLVVLALWGFEKTQEEPPPMIRLVFAEPPPLPARLGAPVTTETTPPQQPPQVAEQPKVEKPKETIKPQRKEPDRLTLTKKKKKSEPIPEPQPELILPPTPERESPTADVASTESQPGIAAGVVGGETAGVVGGVAGGAHGGVIGGQGTGPVPVNQVANPPTLLARVMPDYPQQARRRGIEGLVLLEAILDREGRIEDNIKVLQSIPSLDEAAQRALRRWRFKPARDNDGRPLRVILEVPIRFVLK